MGLINFFLRYEPQKIIISLNNDTETGAGNNAAFKMRNILLRYYSKDTLDIKLPTKKDFGEMNKQEILDWHG
jgi:hypothetical protein